jgi:phosphate starvation-inducible protein PhoH and related proteins
VSRRAKRANKPNPRQERNYIEFSAHVNSSTRQQDNKVIHLFENRQKKKKVEIVPRNISQENYLAALENDNVDIVFGIGPAGTGKTIMATTWAIKELRAGRFERIIMTRPNLAVDDKDIGFLPGDIFKKMAPWTAPILDVFAEYYSQKEIQHMLEENIIEMVPIAYIRGRTFKNAAIIVDEAQGTTINSMLSILTRIGENSKMAVTGDLDQTDRGGSNGLADFLHRFENSQRIAVCRFRHRDIERHPVILEILELYKDRKV